MIARIFSLLLFMVILIWGLPLHGQGWSKLKKEGDEQAKNGFYLEAAESYYKAWKDKPEKLGLAWQAGTWFALVKEYERAAESFESVAHWNEPDKVTGLHYARALKQNGQYAQALTAFEAFIANYAGENKPILETIVMTEIAGCRMALETQNDASGFVVTYTGKSINSPQMDFAPALFGDDVVYFSSTRSGMARLYRSQFQNGKWGKPDAPPSLPTDATHHVANGSFTTDGQHFYYTMCSQPVDVRKQRARCELYVMSKRGSGWTPGQRLPDYINMKDATVTHPSSATVDGLEYLFFTSDRSGGQGGMDLWFVTRNAASKDMDYSFPQNAGTSINTLGDEQTPYYDVAGQALFFSSNGHISFGGMDVFKISGRPGNWNSLMNVGLPVNSSADDTYFRLNTAGQAGFIVSNRKVSPQRNTTQDDDLFFLSTKPLDLIVKGKVLDRMSNALIPEVRIIAYHVDNGEKVIFKTSVAESGEFQLTVPGGLELYVSAEKSEYEPSVYQVKPKDIIGQQVVHNFYLIGETMPDEEPVVAAPPIPNVKEVAAKPTTPQKPEESKSVPAPLEAKDEVIAMEEAPRNEPTPSTKKRPVEEVKNVKKTSLPKEPQKQVEPEVMATVSSPTKRPEGLTAYKNKVRLPEKRQSAVADHALDSTPSTPSGNPLSGPKKEKPAKQAEQTELYANNPTPVKKNVPERTSSVGTSFNEAGSGFMEENLFSGQGLDRRYNGKRVDKRKYLTEAKAYEGIYYRVQLEATDRPKLDSDRYAALEAIGELESEGLNDARISRILVGVFSSLKEAQEAQRSAQSAGFPRAFIVRYEDGVRLRRWK